ncbi:Helix-turn-helix domain protein [Candidatus Izimaplasma bacterium HR1]|jgi:transcriptional regulator with XRE-family HTH domain|uniref:helix-turn-helix domain-containing protein n=1 Tax=Candidatus Izimoplasma sp. HR1 TaxID=1541959 RepID=UPI0004F8F009|nr:Helix-turn-helix domain protein [Candidatus Izimaplasma bacterium HR1]
MKVTSLKNRINKRVELDKFKSDFTDIGSFIKRKRKELNVTQDEISNGICSISYLSKIENNQIVPNDFYVKEIMDRLDIEDDVYSKSIKDKEYIDSTLKAFFYMDDEVMINIYDEVKDINHNVVINLCKLGYTVYFNLVDEDQYVMMLEHVVNNMSNLEVKVYLYFSALYFIQNEKYKVALELILLNSKIRANNDLLDSLFNELSYYVKQRFLIKNSSSDDYHNAMTIFNRYHNVKRIMILALHKALFLTMENPKKAMRLLNTIKVKELSSEIKDLFYIIKAETLYYLNNYKDASFYLKNISRNSEYYLKKMILLLKICKAEEDFETIENIKDIVREYKPKKSELRNKIHYHFLTQKDKQNQKEYLRDIAIPFSIKIDDYDYLSIYTNEVMDICVENSRYKEAISYYNKYQKELNKVRRILY